MQEERSQFHGYEYKKITADIEKLAFLMDGYKNFGWEQDDNFTESSQPIPSAPRKEKDKRTILLKRDRKIINKMELTRLQRQFEACVEEIEALEKAKTSRATIASLVVGLIGTAFMALATFAVTANTPHIFLCILCAVPGFAGWIMPYFVYRHVVKQQTEKLTPLIDVKYDEVIRVCQKGNKLR